jgi:dTDP-4-dehydrorhamnose 3,5-epimerase
LLFIPEGFAQVFSVLSKEGANFIYAMEGSYNKVSEGGVIYNDKDLGINCGVENPILSEKDLVLQTFLEYKENLFM